jgi:dolichyl-phosphate-mannose-protein mannosyltransferase
MLLGLSGVLSRYNGSYGFGSGETYPQYVNYTGMRVFAALFGAFMVPLAYFTAIQMKMSKPACILAASMVLMGVCLCIYFFVFVFFLYLKEALDVFLCAFSIVFKFFWIDLATLTISRFILLDSMLLFFTSLTMYCLCTFRNYQVTALSNHFPLLSLFVEKIIFLNALYLVILISPLSTEWYIWLAATGFSIGAVSSVKWVGLFAIAMVGLVSYRISPVELVVSCNLFFFYANDASIPLKICGKCWETWIWTQ